MFEEFIIYNVHVLAFNGVHVKNLRHLADMVENCEDEFLRFDLEYQQVVSFIPCSMVATLNLLVLCSNYYYLILFKALKCDMGVFNFYRLLFWEQKNRRKQLLIFLQHIAYLQLYLMI
jgi:hypothetical protein